MTEYAPNAIYKIFTTAKALAPQWGLQCSGIIGDSAHSYGYHRGRNYVSSSDYSAQLSDDKKGDGEAACALDITPNGQSGQRAITQNLIDAVNRQDPRIAQCVRSFFGTVDGVNVTGRDVRTGDWVTSDDSHLWHVHLSIIRRYCNDYDALGGVAAVLCGQSGGGSGGDDDVNDEDIQKIATAVWQCAIRNDVTGKNAAAWAFLNSINKGVHDMPGAVWNTQVRNDVTGTPSPAWAFLTSLNTQVNRIDENTSG